MVNNRLIAPSTDFRSVRDGRNSQVFYVDIALDTARSVGAGTALVLPISGNSFYCDADPADGNGRVHFQDTNFDRGPVPLYVSPGCIFNIPFTQILFENAAQAGKKVRVAYGIDVDFQPGSVAQIAVTNAGGFTNVRTEASTGSWADNSAMVANTAITVFTPASNTNGVILLTAYALDASGNSQAFIAKTSAPANVIDGEVMVQTMQFSSPNLQSIALITPQYIAAGKGLYFISTAAGGGGWSRSARYKTL
jgi:hypothetical protein